MRECWWWRCWQYNYTLHCQENGAYRDGTNGSTSNRLRGLLGFVMMTTTTTTTMMMMMVVVMMMMMTMMMMVVVVVMVVVVAVVVE